MDNNQKPKSNLVWAIIATVFCCIPLGIAAIYYASKVDELWKEGNYEAANKASKKAKGYSLWSVIGGVVLFEIYCWIYIISIFIRYSIE